jgi:dTDP-glucose 4,6-dehydratase
LRHLVSGAAGFIGSHLCDRLIAEGHQVVGLDNLITGSRANLDALLANPRFQLIECDVSAHVSCAGPFDQVWHLASLASPKEYLEHPLETLEVGSSGTPQHARDRAP